MKKTVTAAAVLCCTLLGAYASLAWAQQQPDPQRQMQACACKAAMEELSNPRISPQRQIQLNQWVFENCRLKNVGPEECKR